jgi:hypothetical protein
MAMSLEKIEVIFMATPARIARFIPVFLAEIRTATSIFVRR